MKKLGFIATMICMAALCLGSPAHALTLNFSNVPGAVISFNGDSTFSFPDSNQPSPYGGFDFNITSSAPPGLNIGYLGNIDGTFLIGVVTTSGSTQEAPVTGSGTFKIFDSSNIPLIGTIAWQNIKTDGSGGNLNSLAVANFIAQSYSGSNPYLQAFLQGGIVTASFQFAQPTNLDQLKPENIQTSYSGSISTSPVPLPGGLVLLGAGLLRLATYRRRKLA